MDEHISREETIKRIKECYCTGCNSYNGVRCRACGTGDAIDVIEDTTAADVAPVRHAHWETNSDRPDSLICSVCKYGFDMWKHDPHNYCPNCGAKMQE